MKRIIRKSTISLDSANSLKKAKLESLFTESKRVLNIFIKEIWEAQDFKSKFSRSKTNDSWLSARMQQCLGKQALSIVKSQHKKKKKTCPEVKGSSIELDERFVQFINHKNSFDLWMKINSLGNKMSVVLPSRKHHHMNQLVAKNFEQKKSTRLRMSKKGMFLDLFFEKIVPQNTNGTSIGVDVGIKKLITTSDGATYGRGIEALLTKIQSKKQGSHAFRRALTERNEYINATVKEMMHQCPSGTLVLEDIKHMYRGKKGMTKQKRWVYSFLRKKLEMEAEVVGVQCLFVNPAFTSQTCHSCGHVDAGSRHGEMFQCTSCQWSADADHNASMNILKRGLDTGRDLAQVCAKSTMVPVFEVET